MKKNKPAFLLLKNLLTVARGSTGSNAFRKLYYHVDGHEIEALRDGDLSCAVFVSFILKIFSLIPGIHTTVKATVIDLERSGWRTIKKTRPGAILVYRAKYFPRIKETHRHVGIFLGKGKAISNVSKKRSPGIHKWNYRPVEKILWNKKLGK